MNKYHASAESYLIPYHRARGDELLQDKIFQSETILKGLQMLAAKTGAGELVYSPDIKHEFQDILQRRFETNMGPNQFMAPNYGILEDEGMAEFYGIQKDQMKDFIQTRQETFDEQIERLLKETVLEIEPQLAGLAQQMNHYDTEWWARYGVTPEEGYSIKDIDVTMLRNPEHKWSVMDTALFTSDKTQEVDLYDAQGEFPMPIPYPSWSWQ